MDSLSPPRRSRDREDIALLLDVPMIIEAEMGRSNKTVNEILHVGEGSILDFEKEAGSPVDLLVNGKLIARGEVVEIEGNYGVRITELMSAE